ncbi:helix-turn-helix domain-containing protein [Ruthenibacterium lactatiformans]|uniref:Helix-turn-helix domain-containing protein n=2 Tax=Ruthenibacterium lactatiformans TaxID=1550024 RepID=A0A6I3QJH9_9FIRM|nr:helix-turn-helix domain-containing protein [Ruthenibacterium lactatiformans]MTS14910.1 helix-turn-helix domain-containing protein [Ruthenibacterium lactatiformans]MTS17559.1 helix-turn-helix domain-containing protein [Ruthenibacterium lactatiformans]MTS33260.1 helix-turn-helix domain-containing protein [Ruthenibacterium lactatiformans]MTS46685.1 helix-turn-helix domain-containing protein [Ruthenibacterium lactatiformans]MTS50055.1 helix-turn-helix domain-containing protein [Ruthenibacterium
MNYHHLTIEERSCIRKYYVDGLSYREIARLIGRNVSTEITSLRSILRRTSHSRKTVKMFFSISHQM